MNTRRRMNGFVTSDKMDKTVVVEVNRTYRHRLYKKVIHSRRRFMAHDEIGCQIGDHVRIVESRPISRHKRWVVETILRHAAAGGGTEIEAEVEIVPDILIELEEEPQDVDSVEPGLEVEVEVELDQESIEDAIPETEIVEESEIDTLSEEENGVLSDEGGETPS